MIRGMGGGGGGGGRLDDVADIEGIGYDPEVASRGLAYVKPYRRELIVVALLTLVGAASQLLGPYLVKVAIDAHIAVGDFPGLSAVVGALFITYLANYVATTRQVMITSRVGQEVLRTMRQQLFRKLMRLPLSYYTRSQSGVVVSRVINDVVVINDLLTNGLINLFTDVVLLLSTIAVMLFLSTKLALATFAVMPLMVVAIWVFTQRAKVAYRITRQKIGAVAANMQETVSGARVVQAFTREAKNLRTFDKLNHEVRVANINANTLSSGLMPIVEFTSALATVAVIGYGGSLVMSNELTLGVIVAFLTYITRFFQPLRELTQFYNQLQAAMAGGERVFELLDEPVDLVERADPVELDTRDVRGDVEFRHVNFGYGSELVLRDFNLHARPGEMVALVGRTGAGKTTVASLLARYYDPTGGQVLLDGHDLQDVSFTSLRRTMAVVLQDNFMFVGNIRENIRYGRLDATDAEVVEAAKAAYAHHFIQRFPQGYDTPVTERAANLSLGQRQLIAIARAILADPRVLILDEATSSVDPHTEALVQKALERLLVGRTSLVIAHRLSTIEAADQVLYLEHGEVLERGTHRELLAVGNHYARLHVQQTGGTQTDALPAPALSRA